MKRKTLDSFGQHVAKHVAQSLEELRDPDKAAGMAAYMKTDMPFYGVQKPERIEILRDLKKNFKPATATDYADGVLSLWSQPHREEKYFAINYAHMFREFVVLDSMPIYERMIREGAWWDFVDPLSVDLVGGVYMRERKVLKPLMNRWSKDKDKWIRRSSLLCHLHHKHDTDYEQLFAQCLLLAAEKEFFIQKAIGWALREYSKSNPKAVKTFLRQNNAVLSALSYREGAKHLIRTGVM